MTPILAKKELAVLILSIILSVLTCQIGVAQEKEQFKWNLSLKITGGLRYITVGDINDHIESFDDYMSSAIEFYEGGKMEGVGRFGSYLEAELRFGVSPRLSIGIGTGYISGSKKSDFQTVGLFPFSSTTWTPNLLEFIIEPEIKAIPLRLGVYYSLPLAARVNFLLHGGLGYYFAKGFLSKYNLIESLGEYSIPEPPEIFTSYDVSGNGFGVHGGIGLEYKLMDSLFLVIEVQGRYAKIGNLKGTRTYWNTWNYDQRIEEGTLYIGTRDMTAEGYGAGCPDLAVSPLQNMKKAALDFSGFSSTAGFRIRLF
jgi:opacity protein-like surface antigen